MTDFTPTPEAAEAHANRLADRVAEKERIAGYWKDRYDTQHDTLHRMEDRVAELDQGYEDMVAQVAELERALAEEEGSRKGITARCNELESRLQQATELVEHLLQESWPTPSGAKKARAFLAALAGEDETNG